MKPFYLLLLISLFFTTGCEKDITASDLDGEWKLTSRYGGMLPASTPLPDIKLVIKGSNWQIFDQGTLVQSSTYKLINTSTTIDDYKYTYKIEFENSQMLDSYLAIDNNKLRMQQASIAVDGAVVFYEKLITNQ